MAVGWCKQLGIPDPTPGSEAAEFLDYWCAVPGARGLKLDWAATWRKRPAWARREESDEAPEGLRRRRPIPRSHQPAKLLEPLPDAVTGAEAEANFARLHALLEGAGVPPYEASGD